MSHFSASPRLLRLQAAALSGVGAVLLAHVVHAADLDFNVANGNYNVAGNWVDATTGLPAAAPPTYVNSTTFDNAYVRNNGTVVINSDVSARQLRIGASKTVQVGDPPVDTEVGQPGTLNWTAGKIFAETGEVPTDFAIYYGPDIRVGQRDNATNTNFTGIVNQSGGELNLLHATSRLNIGDNGTTTSPTSTYNFSGGTIAVVNSYSNVNGGAQRGTNDNNGINVRNGIFNMTGGQIIDKTSEIALAGSTLSNDQRFMTISTASGTPGSENSATANFSGGTVNVLGGVRIGVSADSKGILNITGPTVWNLGGEVSVGYSTSNGTGIMNMSAGQINVGTTTVTRGFMVGHRGGGTLNQSGGNLNITGELRVGAQIESQNSLLNMTGGTLTTKSLNIQRQAGTGQPAVIIDGPTANFVQGIVASDQVLLGQNGAALFEVRQGQATLNNIQLAATVLSAPTLNVKGGKLKITGAVSKTDPNSTAPVIGLTGGTLEITPLTAGTVQWQTSLTNAGSKLVLNPGVIQQVTMSTTVGTAVTSSFAMSSGSWDLEIGSNVTASGADKFVANGAGAVSLTGGTLNISRINGYTPAVNDTLTILQGNGGTTLNTAGVTLAGDLGWSLISNASQIQLKYLGVPAGVSGDYNGNGVVDAADYVLWRNGGTLQNDPNPGNPTAQYSFWRSRFGATSGAGAGAGLSSAAVPEPSSVALFVLAAVGMLTAKGSRFRVAA